MLLEAPFCGEEAGVDWLSGGGLHEVAEDVQSAWVAHFGRSCGWPGHWLRGGWSTCSLHGTLLLNECASRLRQCLFQEISRRSLTHWLLAGGGIGHNGLGLWLLLLSGWGEGSRFLLRHHLKRLLWHDLSLAGDLSSSGINGGWLNGLELGSGKLLWDLLLRQCLLGNCSGISSGQGLRGSGHLLNLWSSAWLLCLSCWIHDYSLRCGGWHLSLQSWLLSGAGLGHRLLRNSWLRRSIRCQVGLCLLARCRLLHGLCWLCSCCERWGLWLNGLLGRGGRLALAIGDDFVSGWNGRAGWDCHRLLAQGLLQLSLRCCLGQRRCRGLGWWYGLGHCLGSVDVDDNVPAGVCGDTGGWRGPGYGTSCWLCRRLAQLCWWLDVGRFSKCSNVTCDGVLLLGFGRRSGLWCRWSDDWSGDWLGLGLQFGLRSGGRLLGLAESILHGLLCQFLN